MFDTDDDDDFFSCDKPVKSCNQSDDDDDFFLSYESTKPGWETPESADPLEAKAGDELTTFERMKIEFRPMTSVSNSSQESSTGVSTDLPSAVSLPERKRKEYFRRSMMKGPTKQPYAGMEVRPIAPLPLIPG